MAETNRSPFETPREQAEAHFETLRNRGLDSVQILALKALERLFDASERQARIDGLTGLANSRALHEHRARIQHAFWIEDEQLRQGEADAAGVVLIHFDLVGFGDINKEFGHAVGDEKLQVFAEAMQRNVRSLSAYDMAARDGGDEFAMVLGVLDETVDAEELVRMKVEGVHQSLEELLGGDEVKFGFRYGFSIYKRGDLRTSVDESYQLADAKRQNRTIDNPAGSIDS